MADEKKSAFSDRMSELDDFWNIDELVPRKKKIVNKAQTHEAVEIVSDVSSRPSQGNGRLTLSSADYSGPRSDAEIEPPLIHEVSADDYATEPVGKIHYVPPHEPKEEKTEEPILQYEPSGFLLHRVRVYKWKTNYHYFGSFAEEARRYDAMRPEYEAALEPFFSFFPQYSQLGRRQRAFYLWWREQVRAGVYPKTNYSYITLYIFELINLPHDQISAISARDTIALLWRHYHREFPQLDGHIAEWLCDFCLIHAISAPELLTASELCELSRAALLQEFYLDPVSSRGEPADMARFFMSFCCSYDYKKSKFASGEHRELFDKMIPWALGAVLPLIMGGKDTQKPLVTMQDSEVTRDTYAGALCAFDNKHRVTVSYTSFSRSHELRFLIGDIVRHIENRLRAWIGVRSKLTVMSLPTDLRDAVDAFLTPHSPSKSLLVARKTEIPDYEKQYDLPHKPLSIKGADSIEKESWETTRRLTEAFGEGDRSSPDAECDIAPLNVESEPIEKGSAAVAEQLSEPPAELFQEAHDTPSIAPSAELSEYRKFLILLGDKVEFLRAALSEDISAEREYARNHGSLADAVADEINTLAADSFIMDVILEETAGGYRVIDDYRDTVEEMLKGDNKNE